MVLYWTTNNFISLNTWQHIAFSWNGSINANNVHIYVNGSEVSYQATIDSSGSRADDSANYLWIGCPDVALMNMYAFDGIIDEVRLSNVNRSSAWIATEFNNQNSSNSFLSVGDEESSDGESLNEWVELYNGRDTAISLSGWYLTDNDGNRFDLSGAGSIPPDEYLVCHIDRSGTNSSTNVYGQILNKMVLQPNGSVGKDNWLDDTSPTTNRGSNIELRVTQYDFPIEGQRPIIQFNLSNVPSNNIAGAHVWLYRFKGSNSKNATTYVHRMTQSWTESGSNWNTYDGSNAWSTVGGDYDAQIEDTAIVQTGINGWYSWNVTNLVRSWKNGTNPNYGMIFVPQYYSSWAEFCSSDYTIDPTLRPKLVIYHSNPNITNFLDVSDDLALMDINDTIIDYVAWGSNVGTDDDSAVAAGEWSDGEFVDTSQILDFQTIGRDKYSTDTNTPADWENSYDIADPFGIHASAATPGACYIDPKIVDVQTC